MNRNNPKYRAAASRAFFLSARTGKPHIFRYADMWWYRLADPLNGDAVIDGSATEFCHHLEDQGA